MKILFSSIYLFGSLICLAQDFNISGQVLDEYDEGLPGANVLIKSTSEGVATNIDGTFSINAFSDTTLVFSFIGYKTLEIPVNGRSIIDLNMVTDAGELDEVIVVGYGTQEKINMTGSVSTIDDKTLTTVPVANTSNLISGRAPGGITRQNSGLPGGENTQIRIRSYSEAPLVLVDGVQMDFSRVDPNDIASISVLKDASAAVYGARAGNGVILVTTKRGEKGVPRISYNSSITFQSATRFLEHVSASEYVELVREANLNDFDDANAT